MLIEKTASHTWSQVAPLRIGIGRLTRGLSLGVQIYSGICVYFTRKSHEFYDLQRVVTLLFFVLKDLVVRLGIK